MKRFTLLLLVMMALIPMISTAQIERYSYARVDEDALKKAFETHYQQAAEHRNDKLAQLSVSKYLLGNVSQCWSDGLRRFMALYDRDNRRVEILDCSSLFSFNVDLGPIGPFVVKNGRVKVEGGPSQRVSVEKLGGRVLLVVRDARGVPLQAYYNITLDEFNDYTWTLPMQFLMAGNYALSTGEHAVFGMKMPFYEGKKYDVDPGTYEYVVDFANNSLNISYGAGRVSHGDPSSPKYGKMPGGGGAGALMGPMEWNVQITVEGLKMKMLHDERFVDHNPYVADGSMLEKVQSPYEGLAGKWAFASVLPLTPALLKVFPREVLTLMRGEIYARYGDTFADPATQRYFDAQPWYKRSDKPVALTDIEKFNYAMIKYVENGSITWKKYQKQ